MLAISSLYWKAWTVLLILAAFNPASFGRLDLLFSDFSTEVNCMMIYIMCGVAVMFSEIKFVVILCLVISDMCRI